MQDLGVVIIGRNEGERLKRCLASLADPARTIVYVDSASTDGSIALARSANVEVVELDMTRPFTAARARNAGFERLLRVRPGVRFVQFVDGDCEMLDGWLEAGVRMLEATPDAAVACGRLRERFPQASIYNRLCAMEWDAPAGETQVCGGIAMMRVDALRQAQGFNPAMICGEEPELCLRLRRNGWRIHRLDVDMALHDAAMHQFGQWWKRSVRSGWAVAEGLAMYGRSPEHYQLRRSMNIVFYAVVTPVAALVPATWTGGWSLLIFLLYPWHVIKVYRQRRHRGDTPANAWLYAGFCTLAKFPELVGLLRYAVSRCLRRTPRLIEHKAAPHSPADA